MVWARATRRAPRPTLLSHLNFAADDNWAEKQRQLLACASEADADLHERRLLVRFSSFCKMLEGFMYADDATISSHPEQQPRPPTPDSST